MVVSFIVFSGFFFCFFSFRVLFEGINDFHVCLKESFPNLKVGVFFFQFVSWLSQFSLCNQSVDVRSIT